MLCIGDRKTIDASLAGFAFQLLVNVRPEGLNARRYTGDVKHFSPGKIQAKHE